MANYNCNDCFRRCFDGIPLVATVAVTTDTPNTAVIYDIDRCRFNSLPNEGLMLLLVRQAPAAGSDAFLVSLSLCRTTSSAAGVITTSSTALTNGRLEQVTSSEIVLGSRYLVYYNKCQGIFQIVNAITVPAATAGAAGDGA